MRDQLFILGECFWRGGGFDADEDGCVSAAELAALRRAWWRHGLSRVSKRGFARWLAHERCVPDEDVNAFARAMLAAGSGSLPRALVSGLQLWTIGRRDDLRASLLDARCEAVDARGGGGARRGEDDAARGVCRQRDRAGHVRDRFGRLLSDQDMSSIATAMCREVEGHGCLEPDGAIEDARAARSGVLRMVLAQAVIAGAVAMAVYHCVG